MPLITAHNIHKSYRTDGQAPTVVLRGAEFSCQAGEFVALVGPSGAGKSTLLHILASLDRFDEGSVVLNVNNTEHKYASMSTSSLARVRNHDIGMVFQFHHLLPEFTALENVMMPMLIAGKSKKETQDKATSLMERIGIAHRTSHMPTELSGGEQQRVAIARALINDPKILFADEPTGNLDTDNATLITNLLVQVQETTGVACVVATHSTEIAARAHRVVRMVDGRCE